MPGAVTQLSIKLNAITNNSFIVECGETIRSITKRTDRTTGEWFDFSQDIANIRKSQKGLTIVINMVQIANDHFQYEHDIPRIPASVLVSATPDVHAQQSALSFSTNTRPIVPTKY